MNIREMILGADDLPKEIVPVPEWGLNDGELFIRTLTGKERDQFEQSMVKQEGKKTRQDLSNIRARLVCLTAIDKEGNRIFGDDDANALGSKSSKALDRCFNIAQNINGFSDKDIEELEGN